MLDLRAPTLVQHPCAQQVCKPVLVLVLFLQTLLLPLSLARAATVLPRTSWLMTRALSLHQQLKPLTSPSQEVSSQKLKLNAVITYWAASLAAMHVLCPAPAPHMHPVPAAGAGVSGAVEAGNSAQRGDMFSILDIFSALAAADDVDEGPPGSSQQCDFGTQTKEGGTMFGKCPKVMKLLLSC
jgi:hypothetical protein